MGAITAPVIGMVDGSVWGGAFELALVCDLLVAGHAVGPTQALGWKFS